MEEIKIVIGSWGSYNECNERALGSNWLNLSDYYCWEEIEEELKKEGFELDGIDEELFIQDIEGLPTNSCNWDYTHPKELFELLKESEVLQDEYKNDIMRAFLEVRNFDEFESKVKENNLKHIRFHDLRHSCASLLVNKGVPMKYVQEWLGHSTYNLTADTYSHLNLNSKFESANVISKTLTKNDENEQENIEQQIKELEQKLTQLKEKI